MRKILLAALLLCATPAIADGCSGPCDEYVGYNPYRDGPYYGDRRWAPPPNPYPGAPRGTPLGAVTPRGEVAYPLRPYHLQAPVELRKAFPRGVPPGW